MWHENAGRGMAPPDGLVRWIVFKQKMGRIGRWELEFDGPRTWFSDVEQEQAPLPLTDIPTPNDGPRGVDFSKARKSKYGSGNPDPKDGDR